MRSPLTRATLMQARHSLKMLPPHTQPQVTITCSSLTPGQSGQSWTLSGFPLTRIRGHGMEGKEATWKFRQGLSLHTPWSLKKEN